MSFIELAFLAVALSMDALAVSVACGLSAPKMPLKNAAFVAATFGFFQAAMPVAGWSMGELAYEEIKAFDHWIAFFMLAAVGVKMVWDAFHPDEDGVEKKCFACPIDLKILGALAVATSLDALAVGVSFSFLDYPILFPAIFIGITTFALSLAGVRFGVKIGAKNDSKFELLGGVILIIIGVRILIVG